MTSMLQATPTILVLVHHIHTPNILQKMIPIWFKHMFHAAFKCLWTFFWSWETMVRTWRRCSCILRSLSLSLSLYEYSSNQNHRVMTHHSPVLEACSTCSWEMPAEIPKSWNTFWDDVTSCHSYSPMARQCTATCVHRYLSWEDSHLKKRSTHHGQWTDD